MTFGASGPLIRGARPEDSGAIASLSGELGYPVSVQEVLVRIRSLGDRSDCRLLVGESAGAVRGWLQAQALTTVETGLRVEILGLVVTESARRHGIGRALVGAAEAWALEIGAPAVVVRTNATRAESQAFYRRLDYQATKTQQVFRKGLRT